MNIEELAPELAMWNAALALLIEDARDYLQRGPDKAGYRATAYQDLTEGGPMTRHLAKFCALDPDEIARQFRVVVRAVRPRSLNDVHGIWLHSGYTKTRKQNANPEGLA